MTREEMEKEGVDLKLIWILLYRSIPLWIVTMVLTAIVSFAGYGFYYQTKLADREYEAVSQYYIYFSETMEKGYLDYYYNGYTWNDLVSSDWILGYVMEIYPGDHDRAAVDDFISAEILSDVRILTTYVKTQDKELTSLIQGLLEEAVVRYGGIGENLKGIEVIRSDEPVLETIPSTRFKFVTVCTVISLVLTILGVLGYIAVEGKIYLPGQVSKRYGIPVAGIRLADRKNSKEQDKAQDGHTDFDKHLEKELLQNLNYLTQGKTYPTAEPGHPGSYEEADFERFRQAGGVIIEFPQGLCDYIDMDRLIDVLKIQDCPVICGVMTRGDRFILRRYEKG